LTTDRKKNASLRITYTANSIAPSSQPAQFQAATFKDDLATNLARIASYDGVELAIRDPKLVSFDELERLVRQHNLIVPAIGTGQAWGEEGLSFTDLDPTVRRAAIERVKSHVPGAARFNAIIIAGLVRGTLRIKPGSEAKHLHAQDPAWRVNGRRGVVQFNKHDGGPPATSVNPSPGI
jgi:sugar phosphate isomerase/epimerase